MKRGYFSVLSCPTALPSINRAVITILFPHASLYLGSFRPRGFRSTMTRAPVSSTHGSRPRRRGCGGGDEGSSRTDRPTRVTPKWPGNSPDRALILPAVRHDCRGAFNSSWRVSPRELTPAAAASSFARVQGVVARQCWASGPRPWLARTSGRVSHDEGKAGREERASFIAAAAVARAPLPP